MSDEAVLDPIKDIDEEETEGTTPPIDEAAEEKEEEAEEKGLDADEETV